AGHAFFTPAEALHDVAQRAGTADRDYYGEGAALRAFEAKIAALLGKEAAVFMPSGTMAQQIALRIVADASGKRTFAAHATTHVVLHERDGFARLHDLTFVPVGSPLALFSSADVRALRGPVGALL